MSADNGVYILFTRGPEFRVAYTQAIDNVFGEWNEQDSNWKGDPEYILDVFGSANVFSNIEEAYDVAEILERSVEFTEYGICLITDFQEQNYTDLVNGKENGS